MHCLPEILYILLLRLENSYDLEKKNPMHFTNLLTSELQRVIQASDLVILCVSLQ